MIGQACEFDYSGNQACKALRSLGYKIVLVNSNPATMMTDPGMADATYIEPLNEYALTEIIKKERPTWMPWESIRVIPSAGFTLDELPYWREGSLGKYTPSGDYVVVKFAKWAFEKFEGLEDRLGTQMKAVEEVMSIGKTYKEALHKAIRSLEIGRYGLGSAKDFHRKSLELFRNTYIKLWFIQQMKELVELEEQILHYNGKKLPDDLLRKAKLDGFADRYHHRSPCSRRRNRCPEEWVLRGEILAGVP